MHTCKLGLVMKYTCSPSPPQLTDAIEGKKKPSSRDEADTAALEMVQMAETDSEVEKQSSSAFVSHPQ